MLPSANCFPQRETSLALSRQRNREGDSNPPMSKNVLQTLSLNLPTPPSTTLRSPVTATRSSLNRSDYVSVLLPKKRDARAGRPNLPWFYEAVSRGGLQTASFKRFEREIPQRVAHTSRSRSLRIVDSTSLCYFNGLRSATLDLLVAKPTPPGS
jgi:hypothetical protein